MRVLEWSECEQVHGSGWAMDLIKGTVGQAMVWAVKRVYGELGVAGPGASETDNGGTSYGIDVCNTFGCPGTFISEAERERLRGSQL